MVSKIFHANDLNGECLIRPLKAYHNYFESRIASNSGTMKGISFRISQIVTGIFCYPFLAILALLGLGGKVLHLVFNPAVIHNHNERELVALRCDRAGILYSGSYDTHTLDDLISKEDRYETQEVFTVRREEVDQTVDQIGMKIKDYTKQLKKVYLEHIGRVEGDVGSIQINLRTLEHIYS